MNYLKQILTVFLVSYSLCSANAQGVALSAGGNATGGGGSASYSIGQVGYKYNSSVGGNSTDGVQQSYVISKISIFEDQKSISLAFSAFPNPTSSFLNLKIENFQSKNVTYLLTDLSGRQLVEGKVTGDLTQLPMQAYPSSTYLLTYRETKSTND